MTRWDRMEKWDTDSKAFREMIKQDLADLNSYLQGL